MLPVLFAASAYTVPFTFGFQLEQRAGGGADRGDVVARDGRAAGVRHHRRELSAEVRRVARPRGSCEPFRWPRRPRRASSARPPQMPPTSARPLLRRRPGPSPKTSASLGAGSLLRLPNASCPASRRRNAPLTHYRMYLPPRGCQCSPERHHPESAAQTAVPNADDRSNALFRSSCMIDLRAFVAALDWSDPDAAALLAAFAARFGAADDATLVIHGGAEPEVVAAADALGAESPDMVLVDADGLTATAPHLAAVLCTRRPLGELADLPWVEPADAAQPLRPAPVRPLPAPAPVHLQPVRVGRHRREPRLAARHGHLHGVRLGGAVPLPRRHHRPRAVRGRRAHPGAPAPPRPGRRRDERPPGARRRARRAA